MARIYSRWNPPPIHWKAFAFQRLNAKRRGISFRLTYEQWLKIWQRSGHLLDRGRGLDKYCMARKGDCGAYEVGNVRIVTNRRNGKEFVPSDEHKAALLEAASRPKSVEHRRKMSVAHIGWKPSNKTQERMSKSAIARCERMSEEMHERLDRAREKVTAEGKRRFVEAGHNYWRNNPEARKESSRKMIAARWGHK